MSAATLSARADAYPVTRLVYRSRSLIGSGSMLQMSAILDEARPLNARDDITGVLTAVDGVFVQIVEGDEAVIDNLLKRLARDDRHADLTVLEKRASRTRAFGDWDMVSPRLAARELAVLKVLLDDRSADLDSVTAILSIAVLNQTAILEGRSSTPQAEMRRASGLVPIFQPRA